MPTVDTGLVEEKFAKFHQSDLNLAMHLFTTQIGILAGIALVNRWVGREWTATLLSVYVVLLTPQVTHILTVLGTALILGTCWFGSVAMQKRLGPFACAVLIALAYVGQDAAHMITGEATYQSSYSGGEGQHIDTSNLSRWMDMFYEHCYYLVPLVVDLVIPKIFSSSEVISADSSSVAFLLSWAAVNSWVVAVLIIALQRPFRRK